MFDFFKEHFEIRRYKKINIGDKKVSFFVPNYLTKWRVSTLYDKEPDTLDWIDNFSGNQIVFWDIGSNIGLYSIYASTIHKSIKVYSFEPSTSNLRVLSRNISINKLNDKITIVPFALSNQVNKFLNLNEKKFIEGGALNTFNENYDSNGNFFESKNAYNTFGTTIDYIINNKIVDAPNYIKIDVDGIEHLILEGGLENLINKKIKSILIEVNEDFNLQKEKVIKIMKQSNYKLLKKEKSPLFIPEIYNYIYINNN